MTYRGPMGMIDPAYHAQKVAELEAKIERLRVVIEAAEDGALFCSKFHPRREARERLNVALSALQPGDRPEQP